MIGGVALIIFVAIGAFFLSRKYHRRSTLGTFDPQLDETKATPTPYTLGAPVQEARYLVPTGSVTTPSRQSYMPVSAGLSDTYLLEASSADSQYTGNPISPPAYDASEEAHNVANPNAAAARPAVRGKGGYARGPSSQEDATASGAGPSA